MLAEVIAGRRFTVRTARSTSRRCAVRRAAPCVTVVFFLASILWAACGGAREDPVIDSSTQGDAKRPRILVTNDDGYSSECIAALTEALSTFADVLAIAPRSNESGARQSHRAYKRESIQMRNEVLRAEKARGTGRAADLI
jgi:hypothetical protein